MTPHVSVVVPCYNEAEVIKEFHRRATTACSGVSEHYEILYVDDGSTDETAAFLNTIADSDSRAKVIHLAGNLGHQLALVAGMDHATGETIVTMDADLQHPPELIPKMLTMLAGGADIVHAQRTSRTGESPFRRALASMYYAFMRIVSGAPLVPNSGDFRAFTRRVLIVVRAFRGANSFLRGTFAQLGYHQSTIRYDGQPRYGGRSKYNFARMLRLALDGIMGHSATPVRLIVVTSLFLWAVSLTHLGRSLYIHFVKQVTIPGWTSLVVLLFFFTGLILMSMAIIASYIGRIFVQVQNRPLYWIKSTRNVTYDRHACESLPPEVTLASLAQLKEEGD